MCELGVSVVDMLPSVNFKQTLQLRDRFILNDFILHLPTRRLRRIQPRGLSLTPPLSPLSLLKSWLIALFSGGHSLQNTAAYPSGRYLYKKQQKKEKKRGKAGTQRQTASVLILRIFTHSGVNGKWHAFGILNISYREYKKIFGSCGGWNVSYRSGQSVTQRSNAQEKTINSNIPHA